MLITITTILTFLGGLTWWILQVNIDKGEWLDYMGAGFTTILSGATLLIVIILLIVNPISVKVRILQFDSVQVTLDEARSNPELSDFELAAIQQKAVEENKWLVEAVFWTRHPLTNWFWTKKVFELHPIK